MKKVFTFALLLLTISIFHCSDRERLNPLDPFNPKTHGKPSGLTLSSNKKVVSITWSDINNKSVSEYRLWRSTSNQENPSIIETGSVEITEALDTISNYDTTYSYSLSAITDTWESLKSDPESIIPGPFNYWIADFYQGILSRISYDGAHILSQYHFYSPIAIDIDTSNKILWLANTYHNQIKRINMDGELQFTQDLSNTPVDIVVDQRTSELFVAIFGVTYLERYDSNGEVIDYVPCKLTISYNTKIAVDPLRRMVWITVPDSNAVCKVDLENPNSVKVFSDILSSRSISVMPRAGITWIATDYGIVSIDEDDEIQNYLTQYKIYDLDINDEVEKVWLIAFDKKEYRWFIYVIENHGENWEEKIFDNGSYSYISKIRTNPGSENPGILMFENFNNQIIRLDSNGDLIGMISGFSSRLDISVEQ